MFFWLGYQFLGGETSDPAEAVSDRPPHSRGAVAIGDCDRWSGVRHWFDPREGLSAMRAPLDYVLAAAFGVLNFVLSFVGYWYPRG